MPASDSQSLDRWTVTRPDEETAPRGSKESLQSAITRLGPFKHKSHEESERAGDCFGIDGRIALSEELAFERIWILAKTLNIHLSLEQNAPRNSEVARNLQEIAGLAELLSHQLSSLDDITRHRLQTGGSGINTFTEVIEYPLMEAADVAGLPMPGEANLYPMSDTWVNRLHALSEYATAVLEIFLISKGKRSLDDLDKGGNTNLYKASFGSARWAFVNEGWYLYELFKPGGASGTEGGPFHLFLLDVFEYATGLDPEDESKLSYWLKRMSKINREYNQIIEQSDALRKEQKALWNSRWDMTSQEMQRRLDEIASKLLACERRRLELWTLKYPYSYSQKKAG